MIDNPHQAGRLLLKLREALPIVATLTPPLEAVVREQSPEFNPPKQCPVTRIDYAGDDGGIMCRLAFGSDESEHVFFVSITHLTFDRRQPCAREIAAYQKHRVKRMRRLSSLGFDSDLP